MCGPPCAPGLGSPAGQGTITGEVNLHGGPPGQTAEAPGVPETGAPQLEKPFTVESVKRVVRRALRAQQRDQGAG